MMSITSKILFVNWGKRKKMSRRAGRGANVGIGNPTYRRTVLWFACFVVKIAAAQQIVIFGVSI
jgi:hypothetical protein